MPTEKRSSSNHGTRTFTLESLTVALEQVQALHEISADLIAENVFGQPAQQGQGEPVAFEIEVSGYTTLLARTHNKADATAAHYRALGHTVDIRPLGPLADHAEIAQLELEIEQLRFSLTLNDCASVEDDCVRDENRKLRTQLAEAQALLREVGDSGFMADGQIMPSHEAVELQERVEAFVSASAEPSAPRDCAICRNLGNQCMECEEGEFREWADRHFAAADYCKTDAGVFIQDWMRHAYGAWCARGALGRKS